MSLRGLLRPGPVVGIAVLASIPVRAVTERLYDPDLWWHLRTGRLIVETRSIPRADVFSYTAQGRDWTVQEWGAELILHALREIAGLWGIVAFKAVLLLAIYAVVARIITRHLGTGIGAWALIGLAAYAGAPNWTERPNLLSFLLFAITLDLLDRRDGRAIWWFVPLALVWANLHGMVLLGLGLVLLVAIAEFAGAMLAWPGADRAWARRLFGVWGAALLASFINPSGPGLYAHAFSLLRTVRGVVTEWASPNFGQVGTQAFLLLLIVTVAVLALQPGRPPVTDLALVAAFTVLGLQAARNLAVAGIVFGVVVARGAGPAWRAVRGDRPERPAGEPSVPLGLAGIVAIVVAFAMIVSDGLPRSDAPADIIGEDYPVATIDALRVPGVRVFAYDVWANLIIDRAWPDALVYFDLRSDMYGVAHVERYIETAAGAPGWDDNLDSSCTTHALLLPEQALAQLLAEQPGWRLVRSDATSVLYARTRPASGCERYPIPAV